MSTAASSTRPGTSMPGRRTGGRPAPVGVAATTPASDGTNSTTATAANDGDRHRQQEQRLPAQRADEQAADERADRSADRREHVEQAECRAPAVGRSDAPARAPPRSSRSSAPLSAWRTRDSARIANEGATAASSDDRAKATTPTRKTGRWPYRSPRLPLARQRDRHRAQVEGDQRRDRDGVDAELVHDARQGDRQHRRVERHEHGAAGDARASPGR